MLTRLRALFASPPVDAPPAAAQPPPTSLTLAAGTAFPIVQHLEHSDGLPSLDWAAAHAWCGSFARDEEVWAAWGACRDGWLAHLGAALGPAFRVTRREHDLLLSTLDPREADALLGYVARTRARIVRALDGVARDDDGLGTTVIVFDDQDAYYRYVARFYPSDGEFAFSGGMHLGGGCPHFVTVRDELRLIEPVIAHELTHACLKHLPLPAWLNEGIAVNTERRLCGLPPSSHRPEEVRAMHLEFWDAEKLQQFWSGKSFLRSDQGNLLSYDLAQILVEHFAQDWSRFRAFANAADMADGGAAAAHEHLDVDLGAAAAVAIEHDDPSGLGPDPSHWDSAPERGAFRGPRG